MQLRRQQVHVYRPGVAGVVELDYVAVRRTMAAVAISNDLALIVDSDGSGENNAEIR